MVVAREVDKNGREEGVPMVIVDTENGVNKPENDTVSIDVVIAATAEIVENNSVLGLDTITGIVGVADACTIVTGAAGAWLVVAAPLWGSLGYQIGVAVCGSMLLKGSMLLGTVLTGVPSAARMEN